MPHGERAVAAQLTEDGAGGSCFSHRNPREAGLEVEDPLHDTTVSAFSGRQVQDRPAPHSHLQQGPYVHQLPSTNNAPAYPADRGVPMHKQENKSVFGYLWW